MLTNQNAGSIAAKNQEMPRICYISVSKVFSESTQSCSFLNITMKKSQGETNLLGILFALFSQLAIDHHKHIKFLFDLVIFYIGHKKIPSREGDKLKPNKWTISETSKHFSPVNHIQKSK